VAALAFMGQASYANMAVVNAHFCQKSKRNDVSSAKMADFFIGTPIE
jgi:hypothetical protein